VSAALDTAPIDWPGAAASLDAEGYAVVPGILDAAACGRIEARYDDGDTPFRSVIDMARYNFGSGQYKYFDYPLPAEVETLRSSFYPALAAIANRWAEQLGDERRWPVSHAHLRGCCHAEGQTRPTPLLLRYGAGDYNCLHQDLYGPIHFPLQVVVQLSAPGRDFEGGELVLVEQRPRMQSRPIVVHLPQGAAAIIPVRERPRRGARGYHRALMRHGVGRISRGRRTTLGLIFHDAK
jgi:uncharacterized protein